VCRSPREYGGLLDNRSFGGAQVSPHVPRARAKRGGAVLLGAYQRSPQQIGNGNAHLTALGDARRSS